jgi:hypothetical protein
MLVIVQKHPKSAVVPSKLVDLVWHSHILDTEQYKRDSVRMFGRYLDHAPSFGGEEEKEDLVVKQKAMFGVYEKEFGEAVPQAMWNPRNGVGEFAADGEKSPDCCAAQCVKPECAGCVGCNAKDCGYMGDDEGLSIIPSSLISSLLPSPPLPISFLSALSLSR